MRVLAGRYTLEDRVLEGVGWSYWRAVDGVLHRAVGVLSIDPGNPREESVVQAARDAAVVEDGRIQRVLDIVPGTVDGSDCGTCLVSEWNVGTPLEELLASGPLPDAEGARIVLEVARALATGEPQGQHHGRPVPRWVLRTDDGRVRVLGFGTARALEALPGDAGPSDAWYLGSLLYAAVTGRWPGAPDESALPAAPRQGGRPVRPRMVLAGVPSALDEVAARALGLPGRSAPLLTAAAVARALDDATRRVLVPQVDDLDTGRRSAGRVIVACAAVILTVIGGLGYLALRSDRDRPVAAPPVAAPSEQAAPTPSATTPSGPVRIVAAHDFDPDGNKTENPELVPYAVDGNPATSWHTLVYTTATLGNLKPGVGLLLDLGAKTQVAAVQVLLSGPGTSLELRVGDRLSGSVSDYFTVAAADGAVDLVTLAPAGRLEARYLVVWLTRLPPVNGGFQGTIRDIQVFRN